MSIISTSLVLNDVTTKSSLETLFDPKNRLACKYYGDGTHCNPSRIKTKLNIWGQANESRDVNACLGAKIIYLDEEPAGVLAIDATGSKATIIDRTSNSSVYELSDLYVIDKFLTTELNSLGNFFKGFMSSCKTDSNYTKAIVKFAINHPYQQDLLESAGAIELTSDNLESLLGANALHPERFRFGNNNHFQECTEWNEGLPVVTHDGWHNSAPCTNWVDKTIMILGVNDIGFSHLTEL